MIRIVLQFLLVITIASCATGNKNTKLQTIPATIKLTNSAKFDKLFLGGFSGLHLDTKKSQGDLLVFYSLTDRGPNGKKKDLNKNGVKERPFLTPDFSPQIIKLSLHTKTGEVKVLDRLSLKRKNGKALTGLPNIPYKKGKKYFDEEPVLQEGWKPLKYDPWGIDPESIVKDDEGHFWIGEEYGPSLLQVDGKGTVIGRWTPKGSGTSRGGKSTLPPIFAKRKLNGGFEALALNGDKLYAFLQSPIPTKPKNKWGRVLEFDIKKKKTTGVYLYPFDRKGKKLGGATVLSNGEIAIIEHNGDILNSAFQKIYALKVESATNLLYDQTFFEAHPEKILTKKVKGIAKREVMDLSKVGLYQFEKLEGLSTDGKTYYLVNDNDFNVKNLLNKTGEFEGNHLISTRPEKD